MEKKAKLYLHVIFIFIFLFTVSPVYGEETVGNELEQNPNEDSTSYLNNINFVSSEDGDIFTIDITGDFKFDYSYLQNPYRFFIDLYPVKSNLNETELPVNIDGIEKIRIAKQDEDKVRVVFDLKGPLRYKDIKRGDSGLIITFPPRIKEISLKDEEGGITLTISSTYTGYLNPDVFYLTNPDRIVIDIPNTTLMYDNYIMNNNTLSEVKISQYSIYPPSVRIVVKDEYKKSYTIEGSKEPGTIRLYINRPLTISSSKPVIILDAGHGGNDPGAIGPSSLKEKDVTLDIVLYMKGLLESSGYTVILTRDGDYNVSQNSKDTRDELNTRVIFINNNKSAILVSVHCNSANSPVPGGIEVYYYRDEDKKLAEFVCNSLVETTEKYNRGVKKADFFLLKNTTVPAILVEALFISNPVEEKLLMDPLFRRKIAGAIVTGISRYLENR
ncbi:MAG: N-acetylmuramoyl-L-alanine amidase [Dictyoglomi bacterium]|jgi:N-acetylmuramoyl-L-alanine amidase|nr:N-acetylmuramoyl-L-alanine amidase [Dictyoglomota bacterium]